jgi:uncharacterized protein (TIGR03382 family)
VLLDWEREVPLRSLIVLAVALVVPLRALADNFPYVQDGPLITGVTDTEAWVSWYTAHHEGIGTECTIEENTPLLGDHNTDTPTLTLADGTPFTDTNCDRNHKVHLTGLLASTRYTFALDKPWDTNGGTTAAGSFITAPAAGSGGAVKFVVYGDTRNDVALGGTDTRADHQAVVDAIVANEPDAAFLLHTGDLALNITAVSGDDKGYTEFFAVERNLLANRPLFVVLGNHETIDTTFYDALLDPARFDNLPHPYYSSMDWGPVHIALGDSFEGSATTLGLGGLNPGVSDAQAQWLDADLQAARAAGKVSFLSVHQGPYSHVAAGSSGHGGLADVVIKMVPLMVKYGVLASFAGHDHYYQRGHEGCIDYLVAGGGGAPMYAPDATAAGVALAQQTLSYVVVSVAAGGSVSMVAKDVHGAPIDSFTFAGPDAACLGGGTDAGIAADGGIADGGGAGTDAGAGGGTGPDGGSGGGGSGSGGNPSGGGTTARSGCDTGGAAMFGAAALLALLVLSLRRRAS